MEHQKSLEAIGLTKSAARCYLLLAESIPSPKSADDLMTALCLPRTTTYRAVRDLEARGFIMANRVYRLTLYRARPMWEALDEYAMFQRRTMHEILQEQHDRLPLA